MTKYNQNCRTVREWQAFFIIKIDDCLGKKSSLFFCNHKKWELASRSLHLAPLTLSCEQHVASDRSPSVSARVRGLLCRAYKYGGMRMAQLPHHRARARRARHDGRRPMTPDLASRPPAPPGGDIVGESQVFTPTLRLHIDNRYHIGHCAILVCDTQVTYLYNVYNNVRFICLHVCA